MPAPEFLRRWPPDIVPTPRDYVLGQRPQNFELLSRLIHDGRRSENDHRTVVHRVIKDGAGEYQSIEQRDRDADRNAFIEIA